MALLDEPLIITGCPRTGTTALGKLLNNSDGVCIFRETRMFEPGHSAATTLLRKTHRLSDSRRTQGMLDWLRKGLGNPDIRVRHLREMIPLADNCAPAEQVLSYLLSLARVPISVIGDKTPISYVKCVGKVIKRFPRSRWIFVYRDPRAVAFSGHQRFGWPVAAGFEKWLNIMRLWRAERAKIPEDQRIELGPGSRTAVEVVSDLLHDKLPAAALSSLERWNPRGVSWKMPREVKKEMELWQL